MKLRPKIFIHVECFWGIGHAVRAMRIVFELQHRFNCYVITGSNIFDSFKSHTNIHFIKIPTVFYDSHLDKLLAKNGSVNDSLKERELITIKSFMTIRPDVVLIEMFPFGRLSLAMELYMIAELATIHSVPIYVSARDIQVYPQPGKLRDKYSQIANNFVSNYTPKILIHSDRDVISSSSVISSDLFSFDDTLVEQTGYVGRTVSNEPNKKSKKMVLAFGGGRSSEQIISKFDRSIRLDTRNYVIEAWGLQKDTTSNWADFDLQRAFSPILNLDAFVITGGYNSWMDVLSTKIPSVVIALDDEQLLRSQILTRYCPWTQVVSLKDTDEKWVEAWRFVREAEYSEGIDVDILGSTQTMEIISKDLS